MEAKAELIKVVWPTQDQLIRNTILVVALTAVVAVFLGGLDYGFGYVLKVFVLQQ